MSSFGQSFTTEEPMAESLVVRLTLRIKEEGLAPVEQNLDGTEKQVKDQLAAYGATRLRRIFNFPQPHTMARTDFSVEEYLENFGGIPTIALRVG